MSLHSRISIAFKAIRQLGLTQVGLFGLYKIGLKTGYYRYLTVERESKNENGLLTLSHGLFNLPTREQLLEVLGDDGRQALLTEADEIISGKFRMFGGEPSDIQLNFNQSLCHWTEYETDKAPIPYPQESIRDIKFIWEPARFGWAFALGRAYHITGDDRYAESFWRYFDTFTEANPPYLGPNWMSGQEVAIRLMAFIWANQVFADAPASTDERKAALAQAVAHHTLRIPPTIIYARSQNNNHLLTEAAGLYTAALALPEHPQARKWRETGWKWLIWCFENQIDDRGEYVQHSINYHRLMLQTALWVYALERSRGEMQPEQFGISLVTRRPVSIPLQMHKRLDSATKWLMSLTDSYSGRACNFGPNDGAYLFPLTVCPFDDYRPVVQAAWLTFSANRPFEKGDWDEMALWFGLPVLEESDWRLDFQECFPELRRLVYMRNAPATSTCQSPSGDSWAYLRVANLRSRPGHADLNHLDLWWRGLNIAQDAGTYLYNAESPWDNCLTSTLVHNTVTVNRQEQFTRAGRFLYLDWKNVKSKYFSQASDPWNLWQGISGFHTAYGAKWGITHHRNVMADMDETWEFKDFLEILPAFSQHYCISKNPLVFRLHWLLPDWEWELESKEQAVEINLASPLGKIALNIQTHLPLTAYHSTLTLVRAGEYIYGSGNPDPIRGWYSPTYGVKLPALSLAFEVESCESVEFITQFILPSSEFFAVRKAELIQLLQEIASRIEDQADLDWMTGYPPKEFKAFLLSVANQLEKDDFNNLREVNDAFEGNRRHWSDLMGEEILEIFARVEAITKSFRNY